MDSMTTQKDLAHFFKTPENAQKANSLVEDVRYALIDYQVCTPGTLTCIVPNTRCRRRYDWTYTPRAVSRS